MNIFFQTIACVIKPKQLFTSESVNIVEQPNQNYPCAKIRVRLHSGITEIPLEKVYIEMPQVVLCIKIAVVNGYWDAGLQKNRSNLARIGCKGTKINIFSWIFSSSVFAFNIKVSWLMPALWVH